MKLVYISSSTLPSRTANSIHVVKMCHALAKNNCDVLLLGKCGTNKGGNIYSYYGISKNFGVAINNATKSPLGTFFYSLWAVIKAIGEESDLVFSRDLFSAYLLHLSGAPFVYESHSPEGGSGGFRKLRKYVFRKIIYGRSCLGVVVITDELKKHYVTKYLGMKADLYVLPDGADPVPLGTNRNANVLESDGGFNVGYVGQLFKGKGMEVISSLASQAPWASFHIVGGSPEDVLYWRNKTSGLSNIHYYGHLPHGQVGEYIAECDVMLLPNQANVVDFSGADIGQWTSPLKAFEYMAYGKPILCSDIAVLREIFVDRYNALLCHPEKVEEWVAALEALRSSPGLNKRIGENAKADLHQKYSWDIRAKKIISKFMLKGDSFDL